MLNIMKKENRYNYGHAVHQREIEEGFVPCIVDEKDIQQSHDVKDSFLSIVYAPDPRTNLPTGDLNYLVSDKVNPDVKRWVLDNLLVDVSSAAMPAAPSGMSDDDIAALARSPKESVQAYMERVNSYARSNKELYERLSASRASQSLSSQSPGSSVPSE